MVGKRQKELFRHVFPRGDVLPGKLLFSEAIRHRWVLDPHAAFYTLEDFNGRNSFNLTKRSANPDLAVCGAELPMTQFWPKNTERKIEHS